MRARHILSSLRFLTVALVSVGVLGSSSALAAEPKRGGTLRVAYGNEIADLDFHTAPGYEMMWVAMNIGCGLINITPDGKFVGRRRRVLAGLARRSPLHLQAQEERPLPRRHQGGRRCRQIQHRPHHGSGDQVGHAHVLRAGAHGRGARSPDRADPPQAPLRVHSCTCWPPIAPASCSTLPPPPRSTRSRTGRRASQRPSSVAGRSGWSSG